MKIDREKAKRVCVLYYPLITLGGVIQYLTDVYHYTLDIYYLIGAWIITLIVMGYSLYFVTKQKGVRNG